jgi:hypothetical protein
VNLASARRVDSHPEPIGVLVEPLTAGDGKDEVESGKIPCGVFGPRPVGDDRTRPKAISHQRHPEGTALIYDKTIMSSGTVVHENIGKPTLLAVKVNCSLVAASTSAGQEPGPARTA